MRNAPPEPLRCAKCKSSSIATPKTMNTQAGRCHCTACGSQGPTALGRTAAVLAWNQQQIDAICEPIGKPVKITGVADAHTNCCNIMNAQQEELATINRLQGRIAKLEGIAAGAMQRYQANAAPYVQNENIKQFIDEYKKYLEQFAND